MEFIGTIALQVLQKGDPALVQTAQYLSLIAMYGGTIDNIISETTKVELNKEFFSAELEAQQEKLRGLVRTLPQDAFENIWGVLRGVRDTAISSNEHLGDEFESTYQIYAERAEESGAEVDE